MLMLLVWAPHFGKHCSESEIQAIGGGMRNFGVARCLTNVSSVDQFPWVCSCHLGCQDLASPGFEQLEQCCVDIFLSRLVSSARHPFVQPLGA